MKEFLRNHATRTFSSSDEMSNFLKEMQELDEKKTVRLNTIRTYTNNDNLFMDAFTPDGGKVTIPIWDFAIKSLERRSGDTAVGHQLMSNAQILNSMNNYWPLYKDNRICSARIRGDKLIGLDSEQYEELPQIDLFNEILMFLEKFNDVKFIKGSYDHLMTYAFFKINDGLTPNYINAWKKAGFAEEQLNNSYLMLEFGTNDVAESSAKAIITINVSGTRMLVGNPVFIAHRNGHGGSTSFADDLDKSIVALEEELDLMAKLMGITVNDPEAALKKALRKSGIERIAKKACKELLETTAFFGPENAYTVYLYLNGVLDTSYAKDFTEDKKFRIASSIKSLLKEDWTKF